MHFQGRVGLFVLGVSFFALHAACSSDPDSPGSSTPDAGADVDLTAPDAGADAAPPPEAGADAGGGLERSGARLKVSGLQTSDGVFTYQSLYDTKLDVACSLTIGADAKIRCVPQAAGSFSQIYSDAACTSKIATVEKSVCVPGKYVVETRPGADRCSSLRAVYALGAKSAASSFFTKDSGGGCTATTLDSGADPYEVGAEIAATDLVAMTVSDVPAATGIRARVWDGDDGSRMPGFDYIDDARKKGCRVSFASDGKTHCMPASSVVNGGFSDAECKVPLAIAPECVVPTLLFDDSTSSMSEAATTCAKNTVHAFTLGAKRATKDVYVAGAGGACTGPTTAAQDTFDVGAEIAPSTVPEVALSSRPGGRVAALVYSAGGQEIGVRSGFHDGTLNVDCGFVTAADGKLRCLPQQLDADYYSDSACSVHMAIDFEGCAPAKYVSYRTGEGCSIQTSVHAVGAKLDPATVIYVVEDGACVSIGTYASAAGLYAVGAEVPAATFLDAAVVTRP